VSVEQGHLVRSQVDHDSTPTGRDPADEGLDEGLAALSRLSVRGVSLEDLLTKIASFAVRAIPGADGAGLMLHEWDGPDIVVKGAPFVGEINDVQRRIRQGPDLSAAAQGVTFRSGSLGGDPRWPVFGSKVARLGTHSALSLPLITLDEVIGAVTVYAHRKHAFDDRAERSGRLFATPAAIAAQNAQPLAHTHRLAANLQQALSGHRIVDQAIGIMISRSGVTAEEAFDRLRTLSQHDNVKLVEVADKVVQQAVRRARARLGGPNRNRPALTGDLQAIRAS
jgi:GAF domain-containing protein